MTENEMREIEEIAKTMCGFPAESDCKKCWTDKDHICGAIRAGKAVWNAGYRKIPDGAVVIAKDKYDKILDYAYQIAKEEVEQARKEMATSILSTLLSITQDKRNALTVTTQDLKIVGECTAFAQMEDIIRGIALEIGVEVEE